MSVSMSDTVAWQLPLIADVVGRWSWHHNEANSDRNNRGVAWLGGWAQDTKRVQTRTERPSGSSGSDSPRSDEFRWFDAHMHTYSTTKTGSALTLTVLTTFWNLDCHTT